MNHFKYIFSLITKDTNVITTMQAGGAMGGVHSGSKRIEMNFLSRTFQQKDTFLFDQSFPFTLMLSA